MKLEYDLSEFIGVPTVESTTYALVNRLKQRRKELKITQKVLARRAVISYASLRRFETKGEISLYSLLKIAWALDCLKDFDYIFKDSKITSVKDL